MDELANLLNTKKKTLSGSIKLKWKNLASSPGVDDDNN